MTAPIRLDDYRKEAYAPPAMPSNVELEQQLLGALLINNEVLHVACSTLTEEHFGEEIHRRIFDVAGSMIRSGRPANPITMQGYFGGEEIAPETAPGVTMQIYLARLCASATTIVSAPAYAAELVAIHGRRQMIAIGGEIQAAALNPPAASSVDKLIDDAEAQLAALRSSAPVQAVTRGAASDSAARLIDRIERVLAGEKIKTGATTGIPDLDRDTGGLEPGRLWILAGRPGMGKTIACTNFGRAAAKSGVGTLMFSFEVAEDELTARVLSDLTYSGRKPLRYGDLLRGRIDREDLDRIETAHRRLTTMPLEFDWSPSLTVAQIASRVRAERLRMAKAGIKLGVVLIDYLDFVRPSDRYKGHKVNEVGEITGGLKQLAKDQDVCVVLLCQLSRAIEQRPNKRPVLSDLRDSGNIEQDADVVVFAYREAYYIKESADYRQGDPDAHERFADLQNELELITGKVRSGPPQTYKLWADVSCSTMSARAREGL